jgi:hypothetical protein
MSSSGDRSPWHDAAPHCDTQVMKLAWANITAAEPEFAGKLTQERVALLDRNRNGYSITVQSCSSVRLIITGQIIEDRGRQVVGGDDVEEGGDEVADGGVAAGCFRSQAGEDFAVNLDRRGQRRYRRLGYVVWRTGARHGRSARDRLAKYGGRDPASYTMASISRPKGKKGSQAGEPW